jgi:hypothetical protein
MKSTLLLIVSYFILIYQVSAQTSVYSPLLDSNVYKIKSHIFSEDNKYMWYPGQLSAHLQQRRLQESNDRCVNVGYPGNFYLPLYETFFKKDFKLKEKTLLKLQATGQIKLYLNGKEMTLIDETISLPKGKSNILVHVLTTTNIPALKVSCEEKKCKENWKVSLDNKYWNYNESSSVFSAVGNMPLDDPETIVKISPYTISHYTNASLNKESNIISIQAKGYVLIDFYHLEMGNFHISANGSGNLTVHVGESIQEALNENQAYFEQYSIPSLTLTDNNKKYIIPERAIRYAKISCDKGCEISDIFFQAKIWPTNFSMLFTCNDEGINNLWKASIASLHTSTHGFYLDGIKRDYLPWSMDAVLSTFAGDYVFSDEQVSKNSLSVALLPLNPNKSDLGIPDYPLHALIGFEQHYRRYGDFKTILSYRDRMEQLLGFYETLQDERQFISANVGVSWGFVPGWATRRGPDKKGTPTYAQIMLYYNFKIGSHFAEKWGDNQLSKHYLLKAEQLKKQIFAHFWNEEQGIFINGYTKEGVLDQTVSHHAQYWAILAGIFPENRYDDLFKLLPNIPYYKDYVSFEKGYEFMAYAKAGRINEIWDFLFTVFGDWLDQGHSRFPENFSYKKSKNDQLIFYSRPYGLSLCHGANGVPAVIGVLHGIAGFSQSDSNYNHYTLKPNLMNLEWANIEFPVKEGIIKLRLNKNGRNQIEIPSNCKVDVILNEKTIDLNKSGIHII